MLGGSRGFDSTTWVAQLNMGSNACGVAETTPYEPMTIARKSGVGWNKGTIQRALAAELRPGHRPGRGRRSLAAQHPARQTPAVTPAGTTFTVTGTVGSTDSSRLRRNGITAITSKAIIASRYSTWA